MKPRKSKKRTGLRISQLLSLLNPENQFYQNRSNSNPDQNHRLNMSKSNAGELIIFDTGALIQIHTQETFSSICRTAFDQAAQVGVCYLAVPELAGATGAILRDKRITRSQRKQIQDFLIKQLDQWLILPVSNRVCDIAFELCQKHPLKGADAVHLAAIKNLLRFRHARFLTLDKALYKASQRENVPVVVIPQFGYGR